LEDGDNFILMNFIMLTVYQKKVRAIKSGTVRWVGYLACV